MKLKPLILMLTALLCVTFCDVSYAMADDNPARTSSASADTSVQSGTDKVATDSKSNIKPTKKKRTKRRKKKKTKEPKALGDPSTWGRHAGAPQRQGKNNRAVNLANTFEKKLITGEIVSSAVEVNTQDKDKSVTN